MIVELGGTDNQQAVASAIETIQAAYEFGKDLGALISTDMQLKEAVKWAEHWNKYIEDVVRRQRICRDSDEEPKGTEQPPKEPKAKEQPPKDPVPPKTDPEKPTPQPDKPKPKTDEPPADDPTGMIRQEMIRAILRPRQFLLKVNQSR
ncbi:MAG: hypothetical protein MZV63_52700 [Marinilabiliales bacterium]|nr:hypothetical protein [Marinilabiliales bacterium]